MRILLTGGGSGGHITPLLAVADELKAITPEAEMIGVCEKQAKFSDLFEREPAITRVYQVRAGKYRRYSGLKWYQRWFDLKTFALNTRDVFRTLAGYREAKRLLRQLKPDIILIKGGFVGVPVGMAAARLGIPFITHDSDSTPGLANRIVSRWAAVHATGMPKTLYAYPPEKTVYTGIPVSEEFKKVTPSLRTAYREDLGLSGCSKVITIIGGSQGAGRLNEDISAIIGRLMQRHPGLGLVHVAGAAHEKKVRHQYDGELLADERRRVVVKSFVGDPEVHTGAADIVVTRPGATAMAELALQGLPVVIVPGRLAGAHQDKNATYFDRREAAVIVSFGDTEGLYHTLDELLSNDSKLKLLGENLHELAKPHAARELAELVIMTARAG